MEERKELGKEKRREEIGKGERKRTISEGEMEKEREGRKGREFHFKCYWLEN